MVRFSTARVLCLLLCGATSLSLRAEATQSCSAPAPGSTVSTDVYERAAALMGPNLIKRVRNGFMKPQWIADRDEFWYRRESASGHNFVVVDVATGATRPAFDHQTLAAALSKAAQKPLTATGLPFATFGFSGSNAIEVEVDGRSFTCTLNPAECVDRATSSTPEGFLVSPSGAYGIETRSDNNLWLHDLKSGQARPLTQDGTVDFGYGIYPDAWQAEFVPRRKDQRSLPPLESRWSPDSRLVLVPLVDQRHVKPYPFVESGRNTGSFRPELQLARIPMVGERPATFVWYLFDVRTGERRRIELPYDQLILLQQDFIAVREIAWSSDARRLYMAAHGANLSKAFLFEIDTQTGSVRTVIEESGEPRAQLNSSTYNPPNVRLIRDGREALWWSERDGWGHLYRYDTRTGKLLNRVTTGKWLVREIITVDEKHGRLIFTAGGSQPGNPYFRHIFRVNFDGTQQRLLTPENADHLVYPDRPFVSTPDGIQPHEPLSPSGGYVVYNYSRVDLPTRLAIRRVSDSSLVSEVDRADASGLYEAGWRAPEEFHVTAADRTSELWGTIYRPSDFDPTKCYPVIDAEYASPLTAMTARNFFRAYRGRQPLSPSSYAELGFIVVSVDARGTPFRSKQFSQSNFGKLNVNGLDDHVDVIRKLAQSRPYMDVSRVGVIGHSYGGFSAVRAMLEFPDFFKVGISSAGPADMLGMYSDYHWEAYQGEPGYGNGTRWLGNDPTEIPAGWSALTASEQAERLKGKLLIQFGDIDENVPPNSVFRFIDGLIAANRDFEMLYLPGRDHQFIGEGYVMRRDWDFMVRHLAGKEPPAGFRLDIKGR